MHTYICIHYKNSKTGFGEPQIVKFWEVCASTLRNLKTENSIGGAPLEHVLVTKLFG